MTEMLAAPRPVVVRLARTLGRTAREVARSAVQGPTTQIARVFPVYHLAEGLQMALGKGGVGTLSGSDLLSLAVWGAVAAVVAARRFRWEPHPVAA